MAKRTPFEQDSHDIGVTVADGYISHGKQRGPLAGAQVTIDQSMGGPSLGARLVTSIKDQGKLQGRARVFLTIACMDQTTMVVEVPAKHEGAARRWMAQVKSLAASAAQT